MRNDTQQTQMHANTHTHTQIFRLLEWGGVGEETEREGNAGNRGQKEK